MSAQTHTMGTWQDAGLSAAREAGHFMMVQSVPFSVKLTLYPMERLRLLMQTQHTNKTYSGVPFSSLIRTAQHMKSEGLLSPWRGASPTLVRWAPSQYIHLFMKDTISSYVPSYDKKEEYGKYFMGKVGSGAMTGVATALVWAYPLDVLRQQLATMNAGTWANAAKKVREQHGMKGFYRGFLMDAPGLMIFRGVQLGGWDLLKDSYGSRWAELGTLSRFGHGMLISMTGSFMSYPWDTIRRNLISSSGSYLEVFRQGVANAGSVRAFFYAGFSARILSSVVNGALLEGFDEWKRSRGQ